MVAASFLLHIITSQNLLRQAHVRPAKSHATAAQSARLLIGPDTDLHALLTKRAMAFFCLDRLKLELDGNRLPETNGDVLNPKKTLALHFYNLIYA